MAAGWSRRQALLLLLLLLLLMVVLASSVVVTALRLDVREAMDALQTLDSLPFFGGEGLHEVVVVVGMVPDRAGRVGGGVDEELVVGLGVPLADPALGEGASGVLHAATLLGRNAIAGAKGDCEVGAVLVRDGVGGG